MYHVAPIAGEHLLSGPVCCPATSLFYFPPQVLSLPCLPPSPPALPHLLSVLVTEPRGTSWSNSCFSDHLPLLHSLLFYISPDVPMTGILSVMVRRKGGGKNRAPCHFCKCLRRLLNHCRTGHCQCWPNLLLLFLKRDLLLLENPSTCLLVGLFVFAFLLQL